MQLVLCDVCRSNTNKEVPVGTVTKTYKTNPRNRKDSVIQQEFVSEILPLTTVNDNQERLHVCLPCFSSGMTEASKALNQPIDKFLENHDLAGRDKDSGKTGSAA